MNASSTGSGSTANDLLGLLGLLGQSNPLAQLTRSFTQMQKGIDDFLRLVEQFGATMEQMNRIAERVNTLLDEVEPPVRALMPQVTRTIKAGDVVVDRMGSAVDLLADLAKGLQPLAQLAENTSGLLGLKNLSSLRPGAGVGAGDLVRRAAQLAGSTPAAAEPRTMPKRPTSSKKRATPPTPAAATARTPTSTSTPTSGPKKSGTATKSGARAARSTRSRSAP